MKKLLIAGSLTIIFAVPVSATPLIPASTAMHATIQTDDITQIKRKGTARPHGWSKGQKVGWRGRGVPPGQAKKMR